MMLLSLFSSIFSVLFLTGVSFSNSEYYCPYKASLIGEKCYISNKKILTHDESEKACKYFGGTLPTSPLMQLFGWLQRSNSTTAGVGDLHCVYSIPDPLEAISTGRRVLKLAPCAVHLPVLCEKSDEQDCASGWYSAGDSGNCVKPSDGQQAADSSMDERCPDGATVYDFGFSDSSKHEEINGEAEEILKKAYWIPYQYNIEDETFKFLLGDSATDHNLAETMCLSKIRTSKKVDITSCSTENTFFCEIQAREKILRQKSNDAFDPLAEYSCLEGEVLEEGKCYKLWAEETSWESDREPILIYEDYEGARRTCAEHGYTLVEDTVPAIHFNTGWISGKFEGGSMKATTRQDIDNICVYWAGKLGYKQADCRIQLPVACEFRIPGPEAACPAGYLACAAGRTCVAATEVGLAWDEAVGEIHTCPNGGSVISDKATAEQCLSDTVSELWVGAWYSSQGNVLQFLNGDELLIELSDNEVGSRCLKMFAGKLQLADCDEMQHFVCVRPADIKGEKDSRNKALVVVLVLLPVVLAVVVIVLIYRRKGKQMCMGNTAVDYDETSGVFAMNPVAGKEPERELTEDTEADKEELANKEAELKENEYEELDLGTTTKAPQ